MSVNNRQRCGDHNEPSEPRYPSLWYLVWGSGGKNRHNRDSGQLRDLANLVKNYKAAGIAWEHQIHQNDIDGQMLQNDFRYFESPTFGLHDGALVAQINRCDCDVSCIILNDENSPVLEQHAHSRST